MTAADWYVDPLGRYEGRYFDGEDWTDQVKDRGHLLIDPDWNRPSADAVEESSAASGSLESATVGSGADGFDPPQRSAVEPILPGLSPIPSELSSSGGFSGDVTIPGASAPQPPVADFTTESPARQVAVLETVQEVPDAPAEIAVEEQGGSNRRWLLALGAAILAAAVLIALLPRLFGGDEVADDTGSVDTVEVADSDDADEGAGLPATEDESGGDQAMADEDGDAMADDTDSDADGDAMADDEDAEAMAVEADEAEAEAMADEDSEGATDGAGDAFPDALRVGSLRILNGKPMLRDLVTWHGSSLDGRDVTLGANAGCWFGTIGDAVVQNAHCGPVATTPGAEPRFDLVPLRFEDVEDGIIQVRPLTDAVVVDAVLPNGLELVGADGVVDPSSLTDTDDAAEPAERGARGERTGG